VSTPTQEDHVSGYLQGKNIAITGAAGGIGRAVALACAAEGANIVVADFGVSMAGEDPTSEVADKVVAEIKNLGVDAIAVADDVSKMEAGERIVCAAVDSWGSIDGVVCVAGILRERMLFNMTESDWDDVFAVHAKGHFTLFRAASAVMRQQRSGTLIGFTSGAFQGSVAQANYSAAKGAIVSLVRSAAVGMRKYGVTANAIAPVARTRMSDNVPMDIEMGEPGDVAPLVVHLLSDSARHISGQVFTSVGGRVAVWNQPREVRSVTKDGRWDPRELGATLDATIGQERMPMFDMMDEWAAKAAAKKATADASDTSGADTAS
jgi:NAD(P)-dependent dehydrogenase (short-subunit alcohol dehydrogenase family)